MVIALEVKHQKPTRLVRKIRSVFRPCRIAAKIRKQQTLSILQIGYTAYREPVQLKRISPFTLGCSKTILCAKETDLTGTPYHRFESREFSRLMMKNFLSALLKKAAVSPQECRIAYYDPMGEYPEIAEMLLQYTASLTVVSQMPRFYEREAERMMEAYGIPMQISNSTAQLTNCDIVVTSEPVETALPIPAQTLVFSVGKPLVSVKYTVISEYDIPVPYPYLRIKPDFLEDSYYLSALYTLCGIKELGELVPTGARDGATPFSMERLVLRLQGLQQTA